MNEKFPNNKFFRRLALMWTIALITFAVVVTFTDPPSITGGTATALATVVGILATVIGFYQWSRDKEDKAKRNGPQA